MKKVLLLILLACFFYSGFSQPFLKISKARLQDKIRGGWAGQTIGVTFGGPYEFKFNGTFIQDYQPLLWYDGYLKKTMTESPGLYDDLYMDLTFVDIIEKYGINAPVDSFANAFAHAGYDLWHANQAARYNILNGIKPPLSGNWLNSSHADDIDYQIEADYAGLMSPGMPNTASKISDKVGHIMNYGDGWYGGVFVGAMYSLAFTSNDVNTIVADALKTIPVKSTFYQCIADVVRWHKLYPNDWHRNWYEIQKKWSSDIGCADGVFKSFNIDAKINSAYVVLGLLYGQGDYKKSLEIATRAGQDADCNPSTVGGILGTMLGYDKIPAYWKQGLKEAEDIDFKYTTMSLNKVYDIGFKHALNNIINNGGSVVNDVVTIKLQNPLPVKFEQSFPGLVPTQRIDHFIRSVQKADFKFKGTGFVLNGEAVKLDHKSPDYVFQTELYIDGKKAESGTMPTNFTIRKSEVFWKFLLQEGAHNVVIKVLNPNPGYELRLYNYVTYSTAR